MRDPDGLRFHPVIVTPLFRNLQWARGQRQQNASRVLLAFRYNSNYCARELDMFRSNNNAVLTALVLAGVLC